MDEVERYTLWQSLTTWENSPILNYIKKVSTQRRIRSSIKYNIRKLKMGGYEDSATTALIKIGKPAVPALIETVFHHKRSTCIWSIRALGEIADASAVIPLIKAMESEKMIEEATKALIRIGKPSVPALIEELKDEKSLIRLESIIALGKIEDESAIFALVGVWKEGTSNERGAALRALESIGIPAIPELMLFLEDAETHKYVLEAIETVFVNCRKIDQLEGFGKKLDEGYRDLKRRNAFRNNLDGLDIRFSKMKNDIARGRNSLSKDRSLLLPNIPKPPKKSTMYQKLRVMRNV